MNEFSGLNIVMQQFEEEIERKRLLEPAAPFTKSESTEKAKQKRLLLVKNDFWAFDKFYFTKEMYSDGYSEPCQFHRDIVNLCQIPGVNIILGARKHGKTATAKKTLVWLILNKIKFAATLSSTLPVSRNILSDIAELLHNQRIIFDYGIEFIEENADQITFRLLGKKGLKRIISLSEGRSARGATFGFARPEFVLCDDIETLQSPLSPEHSEQRIGIIAETYHSMSKSATILVLGNNFDERCALNRLLIEQDEGILDKNWHVYIYPAWQNNLPLWQERFPAQTEQELKEMLKCRTGSEWLAEFQQKPAPPDGLIFKRLDKLPIWSNIPEDAKGVIYCDPNLSKKGKGDATAIVSLLYSPANNLYYLSDFICHSFSDSNELLDSIFKMKHSYHRAIGFDGNVSQESTWTNNVRNWCRIKGIPFPPIQYCKYHTDELAKNIQSIWNEGRILLPENIAYSNDGKRFLSQIFSFQGKKANLADDAPDSLICAFELLHERNLARQSNGNNFISIIKDYFF